MHWMRNALPTVCKSGFFVVEDLLERFVADLETSVMSSVAPLPPIHPPNAKPLQDLVERGRQPGWLA
jgi:hypothetical protein